jgi:hypothetical protein
MMKQLSVMCKFPCVFFPLLRTYTYIHACIHTYTCRYICMSVHTERERESERERLRAWLLWASIKQKLSLPPSLVLSMHQCLAESICSTLAEQTKTLYLAKYLLSTSRSARAIDAPYVCECVYP